MMAPVKRIDGRGANPEHGRVVYDLPKFFWNVGMITMALCFAPFTIGASEVLLFIVTTYLSLLVGHSAGMHRLMIHQTYTCQPVVEKLLIYIGTLVGMSGPLSIIKIHDLRDWAQRQKSCHDFFSHKRSFFCDIWWQLTCRFEFQDPPLVKIEKKYSQNIFYLWLEKTWRLHQLALAILLFALGGWSYVVWGIFVRVSVSIVGHWSITYFCHNPGPGKWRVKDAAVQASNIPWLGLVTYGECWHNNHHAFPESARIGLAQGQQDPAWWFIKALAYFDLAKDIGEPRGLAEQDDVFCIEGNQKLDDESCDSA